MVTSCFALLAQLHAPSLRIPYYPEHIWSLQKWNYEKFQPFYLEILESKQEIQTFVGPKYIAQHTSTSVTFTCHLCL